MEIKSLSKPTLHDPKMITESETT